MLGAMATLGETPVFRNGFGVAMFVERQLRFSSYQHAHASVGMAPGSNCVTISMPAGDKRSCRVLTMITVGVDLGGTFTRVGAVDGVGRILCQRSEPTSNEGSFESAADRIAILAQEVIEEASRVSAGQCASVGSQMGVALAGIVDPDRGRLVRTRVGLSAWAFTDIEAATWAEYRYRKPIRDPFVHLRIGTGVGCSLIKNGRIEDLPREGSGHLDVLIVDDRTDARLCPCGRRGCLETYVSGHALEQQSKSAGLGSKLEQAAAMVTTAIRKITENTGAETVCIGGGVIEALPSLLAVVRRMVVENIAAGKCPPSLCIEPAMLGNHAGIIGAALLARAASQH